jgi:hypothetical protein
MQRLLAILIFPLKGALWLLVSAFFEVLPSVAWFLFVYLLAIAVLTVITAAYLLVVLPFLVPFILSGLALYLIFRALPAETSANNDRSQLE